MLNKFTFWDNKDWDWYKSNIPFFESPDNDIDLTYYYRWELITKHLVYGSPTSGYASTEFIDRPWWSGTFGAISCAAGHQLNEFLWFKDKKYFENYSKYWFNTPGAQPRNYSTWISDAVWQGVKVIGNNEFAKSLLPSLIENYHGWEKEHWVKDEGMFAWDGMHDGMETNINSRQTSDWFAGASGYRPTLNSYMWADAKAIENIALLSKDQLTAKLFTLKADTIKSNFQKKCWDPKRNFFFHRFQKDEEKSGGIKANTLTYETGKYAGNEHGREEIGFIPWAFNMPDKGFESAWQFLMLRNFFFTDFGPTTVEQKDPMFTISKNCCVWSGNSWPFATSQTLKAMANVIRNYQQLYVSKDDYFDLLKIFTMTQRKDGKPYIAEACNPLTGSWSGHDVPNHSEHYFHSSYIDLIISGLVGLEPQANDSIIVNPLIPDSWDYFCLDEAIVHGHSVSVVWDRTGTRYNKGVGLNILSDGKAIASSPTLTRLVAYLPNKPEAENEKLVNYAINNQTDQYFPHAIASFCGIEYPYTKLNDGQFWYLPFPSNRWATLHSNNKSDWAGIDFGINRPISEMKIYPIDDDSLIRKPVSYLAEYWTGNTWKKIPEQIRNPLEPEGHKANRIRFKAINTSKVRVVIIPVPGYAVGLSEIEAWGTPAFPIKPGNGKIENIAYKTMANVKASFTSQFDDVNGINDGNTNPIPRWTAFGSPNKSDWVEISFNKIKSVHTAYIYLFDDNGGVQSPSFYEVEFWNGNQWKSVTHGVKIPATPKGNSLNLITFNEVKTDKIRIVFTHKSEKVFSGVYEIELYGNKN